MKRFLLPLLTALALPTAVNANLKEQFNQINNPRKAANERCMGYFNKAQYEDGSRKNRYLIERDNDVWYIKGPKSSHSRGVECTYQLIGVLNKNFTFDICKVDDNLPFLSCTWHQQQIESGWAYVSREYTTYFEIQGDNLYRYVQMGSNEIRKSEFRKKYVSD